MRRWPNIKPTLVQHLVLAGTVAAIGVVSYFLIDQHSMKSLIVTLFRTVCHGTYKVVYIEEPTTPDFLNKKCDMGIIRWFSFRLIFSGVFRFSKVHHGTCKVVVIA